MTSPRSSQRRWPTVLGLTLLATYLSWNAYWLTAGRIPPSLLTGLTGIPSPTTGGTRSFRALLTGNLRESLVLNPMTIPILVLLGITLAQVLFKRRGDRWLASAWLATMAIAWVMKLLSPTATW